MKIDLRDTKNGHERIIKLLNRTCAALQQIPNLGQKGPLFLRYDGRPYETATENRGIKINSVWNRARDEIGLDKTYTPHVARHSWATWYYSQTRDSVSLQLEGGWRSDEYKRYLHFCNSELGRQAREYGFEFEDTNENILKRSKNTA